MSAFTHFAGRTGVTVDRRASKYDFGAMNIATMFGFATFNDAILAFNYSQIKPVVIVREDGSAVFMSGANSGPIWVVGYELNSKQQTIVDEIRNVMLSLGGGFDATGEVHHFIDVL